MMTQTEVPEKLVGALTSGLAVLRYLSDSDRPVGVSQVARDLNLNPSTCFNLLKTLVHEGFAAFDDEEKTYVISYGIITWLNRVMQRDGLITLARPRLEAVAEQFNVTATLWTRVGQDRVLLIDRADSSSAIRIHMNIGQRLPLYIAALGRCMAAHDQLPARQMEVKFNSLRWQNAPSFEAYMKEVDLVRQRGYAVDRDNFVRGITTVSAPILDKRMVARAAISSVGLSGQVGARAIETIGTELRRHANAISSALAGHSTYTAAAKDKVRA